MRKTSLKAAGLAAMLSLCLLLTGCYIAPDDVNNGPQNTGGNSLPFQTLAPTPTVEVTPDTVVIEPTQNVFGNQGGNVEQVTATPTPTPGPGGWSDWGNPQETDGGAPAENTPVPGGTIVFATATPNPDGVTDTPPGGIDAGAGDAHGDAPEPAARVPGGRGAQAAAPPEGTGLLQGQH